MRLRYFTAFLLLGLAVPLLTAHATVHHVEIGNFYFSPAGTTVQYGDTVRWIMVEGFSHTTTSEPASAKTWDSGIMNVGDSFQVTIEVADGPGPFPYICSVHPFSMQDTLFVAPPPAEPTVFAFLLDADQADACAGTGSTARGFGVAVLGPDSSTLSLYVEHNVAAVSGAHVHLGSPCVSGGIAFGFTDATSPINETWALTPTDVSNLLAGDLYVNIHSAAFPSGEIRGQITDDPIPFVFTLDEAQAAGGTGTGSLNSGYAVGQLAAGATEFSVTVEHEIPSDSVVDAHIHLGPPGVSGGVEFGFASPVSPVSGTWLVDTLDLRNLLRGDLYVNVHSQADPGGEIRGQIQRTPIRWFLPLTEGEADGGSGTGSSATGFCLLELNADMNELTILCEHDVVDPTDAHIHLGAPGISGPIQFGFSSPVSPISDSWSLSAADVDNLLAGDLYVNIHSASFPAGEIRGQVDQDPIILNIGLSEEQADACIGTGSPAVGQAAVSLKPGGRQMVIEGTHDVADPSAAHVHLGSNCTNGPIQFGFSSPASPFAENWYLGNEDVAAFLRENLYLNIHSTAFPSGEIRGQLAAPVGCCTQRGDVDESGTINVADLTFLVNYLFKAGPVPACPEHGDVDASATINVADLTYIVNYLFKGGPAPVVCP